MSDCPDVSQLEPPFYNVPDKRLVTLEHPYIIKNRDRGVESLGGFSQLRNLVHREVGYQPQAKLYQRPGDRLSKPMYSHNQTTHNVVLKITVPKPRGMKRKRGSVEPALSQSREVTPRPEMEGPRSLVRSLNDNPKKYQVEAVGIVEQTHRFRSLPDFVKSSAQSPFMRKMQETVLPFEYEKLKGFKLDMSKGVESNPEIIPPPKWSHFDIPFNYAYRQNPGVQTTVNDLGQLATKNAQVSLKVHSQPVLYDSLTIPTGPSPELPPVTSLEPGLQQLITAARKVMETRPIVTRRSLPNLLSSDHWTKMKDNARKVLYQYIGYIFASGPWRDAVVRFGVDPRFDRRYRIYQTLMFVIDTAALQSQSRRASEYGEIDLEGKRQGHIFDGTHLSPDGKVWQVCDITDPVLKDVLATENLREECHVEGDGWYHSGTWAKAKIIMRWKITDILTGTESLTDEQYARVVAMLPESMSRKDQFPAVPATEGASPKERELLAGIRALYRREKDDDETTVDHARPGGAEQGDAFADGETGQAGQGMEVDEAIREARANGDGVGSVYGLRPKQVNRSIVQRLRQEGYFRKAAAAEKGIQDDAMADL